MNLLFFALVLFATLSFGKWIGPVELPYVGINPVVSSVYRDPTSHINHVICGSDTPSIFHHLCIDDTGNVVHHTTMFQNKGYTGVLRGAGDGRHIYLALWLDSPGSMNTVAFMESSDGGIKWTPPVKLLHRGYGYLNDMLYINETGRIFVFFTTPTFELKMATRPPNSSVFGQETLILTGASLSKAVYTVDNYGKQLIHLFYTTKDKEMAYIQSSDNGVSWSDPKIVISEPVRDITHVIKGHKSTIYVAYILKSSQPAKLIWTEDLGNTFSTPLNITKDVPTTEGGISICGAKEKELLPVLWVTHKPEKYDMALEYSFMKSGEMEIMKRPYPITSPKVISAGLDCDAEHVASFVVLSKGEEKYLYFSLETDFANTHEEDS